MTRSPQCQCGHAAAHHEHYRPGTDCSRCACTELRRARGSRWSWLLGASPMAYLGADAAVWTLMSEPVDEPATAGPSTWQAPSDRFRRLTRKETRLVRALEDELRAVAADLVDPRPGECLRCYVARTTDELGCDGTLRWSRRFRDLHAPGQASLDPRRGESEACDCRLLGVDVPADDRGCRGVVRGHEGGACSLWHHDRQV
ncbi:DUF2695 domain-containing protein [Nocardioides bruguierae]|uniref:DUF2695 domain-containing protein n=1 Tax=Nocardioides bruguierae TaxID=2945102 RepID=UPI0020206361|nr:DUF2695 domain-containing protein [Nocardioides bruguierae]MCL8025927.1 DUF2695 domain-containing protein [Nocardioides bruguierae]